jgi:hypothetical protein
MPSTAINWWRTNGVAALDQIAAAHLAVGGPNPGRRYATGQINNAYTVLIAAQFQRFCRDLHSQSADFFAAITPVAVRSIILVRMTEGRALTTKMRALRALEVILTGSA